MTHGRNISVKSAKEWIADFVSTEPTRSNIPVEEMVVGHRFDLSLIKTLISEIEKLKSAGNDIDSIRIYNAINLRDDFGEEKKNDLVIVPTLSDGTDYHQVFHPLDDKDVLTLVGKSTPCPNVCQRNTLSWPSDPV